MQEIYDATTRMRDFLRDSTCLWPVTVLALATWKGCKAYQLMVEGPTTLPRRLMNCIRLKEVKRIKNDMLEIKDEVNFEGTLNEFFDYVRTDPRSSPKVARH